MDYNFNEIEKMAAILEGKETYRVDIDHNKPKYYVSRHVSISVRAGLHVGHPLGYIV